MGFNLAFRGLNSTEDYTLDIQFTNNPELTTNTITKHLLTATLANIYHICYGYEEFIINICLFHSSSVTTCPT